MTRPLIGISDGANTESYVREMTDEEYAQYLIDLENYQQDNE